MFARWLKGVLRVPKNLPRHGRWVRVAGRPTAPRSQVGLFGRQGSLSNLSARHDKQEAVRGVPERLTNPGDFSLGFAEDVAEHKDRWNKRLRFLQHKCAEASVIGDECALFVRCAAQHCFVGRAGHGGAHGMDVVPVRNQCQLDATGDAFIGENPHL
jgi:hypothetical protein